MIAFILLLLAGTLLYARPSLNRSPWQGEPWLSRERTSFVNGYCICLVFLCHLRGYNCYSQEELRIFNAIIPEQLIVTTFFFYSGYGIMCSIAKKGKAYVTSLATRRFTRILLNFDIAVVLYFVLQCLMGKEFTVSHIFTSLVGWTSVGNSNWFIFMTLLAYLLIFLSFSLFKTRNYLIPIAMVGVFMLVCIYLISQVKAAYWVNTWLCIPAGMVFAVAKKRMERLCAKIPYGAVFMLALLMAAAGWLFHLHPRGAFLCMHVTPPPRYVLLLIVNFGAVLFAGGLTLVYAFISFRRLPSFMVWLGGVALFPAYIMQRIPMIAGSHWGWNTSHPELYVIGCLLVSLLLTAVFQRLYLWVANTNIGLKNGAGESTP